LGIINEVAGWQKSMVKQRQQRKAENSSKSQLPRKEKGC
jgi:hypothetical protein